MCTKLATALYNNYNALTLIFKQYNAFWMNYHSYVADSYLEFRVNPELQQAIESEIKCLGFICSYDSRYNPIGNQQCFRIRGYMGQ